MKPIVVVMLLALMVLWSYDLYQMHYWEHKRIDRKFNYLESRVKSLESRYHFL